MSENKFTRAQVLDMEKQILQTLEFDVTTPSALRFLERFWKLMGCAGDRKIFFFAQYLQEIALLDASLLKYRASELAAASLVLALKNMPKITFTAQEMEEATKINENNLQTIVEDVRCFIIEVNPKFLTTLKYKFSKPDYMEVALESLQLRH